MPDDPILPADLTTDSVLTIAERAQAINAYGFFSGMPEELLPTIFQSMSTSAILNLRRQDRKLNGAATQYLLQREGDDQADAFQKHCIDIFLADPAGMSNNMKGYLLKNFLRIMRKNKIYRNDANQQFAACAGVIQSINVGQEQYIHSIHAILFIQFMDIKRQLKPFGERPFKFLPETTVSPERLIDIFIEYIQHENPVIRRIAKNALVNLRKHASFLDKINAKMLCFLEKSDVNFRKLGQIIKILPDIDYPLESDKNVLNRLLDISDSQIQLLIHEALLTIQLKYFDGLITIDSDAKIVDNVCKMFDGLVVELTSNGKENIEQYEHVEQYEHINRIMRFLLKAVSHQDYSESILNVIDMLAKQIFKNNALVLEHACKILCYVFRNVSGRQFYDFLLLFVQTLMYQIHASSDEQSDVIFSTLKVMLMYFPKAKRLAIIRKYLSSLKSKLEKSSQVNETVQHHSIAIMELCHSCVPGSDLYDVLLADFIEQLSGDDVHQVRLAARALSHVLQNRVDIGAGSAYKNIVKALLVLLKDQDPAKQEIACEVLKSIPLFSNSDALLQSSANDLLHYAINTEADLRQLAAEALRNILQSFPDDCGQLQDMVSLLIQRSIENPDVSILPIIALIVNDVFRRIKIAKDKVIYDYVAFFNLQLSSENQSIKEFACQCLASLLSKVIKNEKFRKIIIDALIRNISNRERPPSVVELEVSSQALINILPRISRDDENFIMIIQLLIAQSDGTNVKLHRIAIDALKYLPELLVNDREEALKLHFTGCMNMIDAKYQYPVIEIFDLCQICLQYNIDINQIILEHKYKPMMIAMTDLACNVLRGLDPTLCAVEEIDNARSCVLM